MAGTTPGHDSERRGSPLPTLPSHVTRIIFLGMPQPPHVPPPIHRLRITPDEPAKGSTVAGPLAVPASARPKGTRRPHPDSSVRAVRHLVETTTLTFAQIQARTGVSRATITLWKRNHGWTRPAFAARHSYDVPLWRAGPRQKTAVLTGRLVAIAERMVRDLEEKPDTDVDKLVQAMEALKMARLEARTRNRHWPVIGPSRTGRQVLNEQEAIHAALKEMRRGGVDLDRAPKEALDLVIEANTPAEQDHPALRPRGARWR